MTEFHTPLETLWCPDGRQIQLYWPTTAMYQWINAKETIGDHEGVLDCVISHCTDFANFNEINQPHTFEKDWPQVIMAILDKWPRSVPGDPISDFQKEGCRAFVRTCVGILCKELPATDRDPIQMTSAHVIRSKPYMQSLPRE